MSEEVDYDDLPEVTVTMNQTVAYNIAYFRKVRGLTQEDLGELLSRITGKTWSKATMSAVERSWDGTRIRQFDADEIMAFSQALGFPVPALFLPPTDDGVSVRYSFQHVASNIYSPKAKGEAGELIDRLFSTPDDGRYAEDGAYVARLEAAFSMYGEPDDAVIHRPGKVDEDDYWGTAEHATFVRTQITVLRGLLGSLEKESARILGTDHEPLSRKERDAMWERQLAEERAALEAEAGAEPAEESPVMKAGRELGKQLMERRAAREAAEAAGED